MKAIRKETALSKSVLLVGLTLMGAVAQASVISLSGLITQSTQDGTGPAQNNPSLNNIGDGQKFDLSLSTPISITGPGTYTLDGSALTFSVFGAPAVENHFSSVSLTITASGGNDVFSLLACLQTGSGCNGGNQLTANFQIPVGQFNGVNVPATGLDQPHPLDLLEDDGVTDIQGSVTRYSSPSGTVPEPRNLAPFGLAVLSFMALIRKLKSVAPRTAQ